MQMRSALGGIPVMRAMITDFRTLRPDDPLAQAVEHVLAGFQQDFPVVEDGRLVGVLTRNDLAAALGRHGPETRVGEVMQRDFVTVDPPRCCRPPSPGCRTATVAPCPSCKTAASWGCDGGQPGRGVDDPRGPRAGDASRRIEPIDSVGTGSAGTPAEPRRESSSSERYSGMRRPSNEPAVEPS